jgi:ferredoxin
MRVWIDQDLCTGDGICEEICPDLFFIHVDGLAYVKDRGTTGLTGTDPTFKMAAGQVFIPNELLDATIEASEECPGECIFIDA